MTPEESLADRIERADSTTYFHFSEEERARLVTALRSTIPSPNAVTGSSGTHPVPEGAADNAPPAIRSGMLTEEERHAIGHARHQVERSNSENPDCTFDYELVRDLLCVIDRSLALTPAAEGREALVQIKKLISSGDRATVNEQNAFVHFTALNRMLLDIRDIARAALQSGREK